MLVIPQKESGIPLLIFSHDPFQDSSRHACRETWLPALRPEIKPCMSLWSRVANVFRADRVDSELDEELQFHVEERIRALTDAGMTPEAAAAEARRRLGSPLRLREQSRDVKLLPWLESLLRDLRLGARTLRRDAGVTGTAVISLSLALGACIAAFSLIDALILRPLPVRHPEQLIYLAFPTDNAERPEADTFNDPLFVRLRDAARERVDLFAMSTQVMRKVAFADAGGEKEQVRTQFVSGGAFDTLGHRASHRAGDRTRDDERAGRRTGGGREPRILDASIRWRSFDCRSMVRHGRSSVPDRRRRRSAIHGRRAGPPDRPVAPRYATYNPRAFGNFDFNWFRILGRVHDGVPLAQATSVLATAFENFRRDRAAGFGPDRSPESVARFLATPLYVRSAAGGPSPLRQQFERSLWILGAIAALVLVIAGSNVANLFLARAAVREREMALRLSIGAGRGRLIQQVVLESALVAGAAGVLGLLFAGIAAPAVVGMLASADDPVHLDLRVNWQLLAFAGGLTLLTTVVFGLAPAFRASSVAPLTALKTGGDRSSVRAAVMRPFVAVQVAFGLVVVFVGGLLVLSFARLSHVNPGFATSDVLLLSLEAVHRVDPQQQRTALLQVLERLRAVPGVQAVSSAESNMLGRAWTHYVRLPGTERETLETTMVPVTPGFFDTMRIPLLAGRTFGPGDMETKGSSSVVVNEAFATRYFGREPAVGRTFDARFADISDPGVHEVVGAGRRHEDTTCASRPRPSSTSRCRCGRAAPFTCVWQETRWRWDRGCGKRCAARARHSA